jgi:SOS response regulatory protein OraA/RecX
MARGVIVHAEEADGSSHPSLSRFVVGESDEVGPPPIVTAVRSRGATNVEIELNEQPWRVLPLAAVARAGIASGVTLDREHARALNRALRRDRAFTAAARLLRHSDQTTAMLETKLARRGVATAERAAVVQTLTDARVVDDVRFAQHRAETLCGRLYGNDAIRHDLHRRGIDGEQLEHALAGLEPESERVERVVEARGASRQTLTYLARRGFSTESLDEIVARVEVDGLG